MSFASPRRRAHTSQRATGRFGVFSTAYVVTTVLVLGMAPVAFAGDPPASAGWHGRAIQEPRGEPDTVAETVSLPRGWSAGPVRLGTGYQHPGGSERVREVQRRLWKLGFRPGPVDGLFGPRTRAAVQWFQIKHGYPADGVVDLRTLALLRQRTGAGSTAEPGTAQEPVRDKRPAVSDAAPQPRPATQRAEGGQRTAAGTRGSASAALALVAIAVLAFAAPLALVTVRRRGFTRPTAPMPNGGKTPEPSKQRRPNAPRELALGPASQPAPSPIPGQPLAIGYVRGADRAALARHGRTIRQACSSRGWKLAELVREESTGANGTHERSALAAAMERLSEPGEARLVVSKLAHLSRSAAELTSLFEWFAQNEVRVIAADAGIDTTTAEGRDAAQVLLTKVARRQAESRRDGRSGHGSNGSSGGHEGHAKSELAGAASNGKG